MELVSPEMTLTNRQIATPPPLSYELGAKGLTTGVGKNVKDKELIELYLAWLSVNAGAGTIRARRYQLRQFAREHDLAYVTVEDVTAWLSRPSRQANARKSFLSALRSFYKWAVAAGYLDHNPTVLVHSVKVPEGVPKPCPEDVLGRALARADEETKLMLMCGAYAGMRRAEIAALHSDYVTHVGFVFEGKGRKMRRVPIHPNLAPLLTFEGYAFPSPLHRRDHVSVDYVADRVEAVLEGWTTHSLRHRFATQAYRATKDIRAVQQLLGHASPTTTARYVLLDEDVLAAVVQAVA